MATLIATVADFSLKSTWTVVADPVPGMTTPTTSSVTKYFDLTGIPSGSVIASATLTANWTDPLTGPKIRTVNGISFGGTSSGSLDILSEIKPGQSTPLVFRFRANGTTSPPLGNRVSQQWFKDTTITVVYTSPDDNIGAIDLDKWYVTAGETVKVTVSASDVGMKRYVDINYGEDYGTLLDTVSVEIGDAQKSFNVNIPASWCEDIAPDSTSAELQFKLRGEIFVEGDWVPVLATAEATLSVDVPAGAVPTISSFTAQRQANDIDPSITEYIQGYSGVKLTISGAAGALGSTIIGYEIMGDGYHSSDSQVTFTPVKTPGTIEYTARVTDSRGRTAQKTQSIDVVAYDRPVVVEPAAWRASDAMGTPDDEGGYIIIKARLQFSDILDNVATLHGRVYEVGTAAPAWTALTSNVQKDFGGGLSHEAAYTVEIRAQDLITAHVWTATVPSSAVAIDILPNEGFTQVLGVGLGEFAQQGQLRSAWPIYAESYRALDERYDNEAYIMLDDTDTGILIITDVEKPDVATAQVRIKVDGTVWQDSLPVKTVVQAWFHGGNGAWVHGIQYNIGVSLSAGKAMVADGYLAIWLPGIPNWTALTVAAWTDSRRAKIAALTASDVEPAGSYKAELAKSDHAPPDAVDWEDISDKYNTYIAHGITVEQSRIYQLGKMIQFSFVLYKATGYASGDWVATIEFKEGYRPADTIYTVANLHNDAGTIQNAAACKVVSLGSVWIWNYSGLALHRAYVTGMFMVP